MRRSATLYLGTTLLFVLASLSTSAVAEIYKWVDAQGNVHFGDKPTDARVAGQAEEVEVDESYKPPVLTPEEQKALDEQRRKERLREEMRIREEQKAEAEEKLQRDQERDALCAELSNEIEELETVTIKDGVRHITYATDEQGKPLTSDQQRQRIADLKVQRDKAGCK